MTGAFYLFLLLLSALFFSIDTYDVTTKRHHMSLFPFFWHCPQRDSALCVLHMTMEFQVSTPLVFLNVTLPTHELQVIPSVSLDV